MILFFFIQNTMYCNVLCLHWSVLNIGQLMNWTIDDFQINEIIIDLRISGFDNEVFSVDACAVWWERESFYCLPRISVEPWHREPRLQCGSARTGSIWNLSIVRLLHVSMMRYASDIISIQQGNSRCMQSHGQRGVHPAMSVSSQALLESTIRE